MQRRYTRIHSARQHPDSDPGFWSHESLKFSEKVAKNFVQEIAEWSVLYAKELA